MKILVTGPKGQIGWELMRLLPALGEVVAADRSVLDLTDARAIARVIADVKPDVIVNAAGYTNVDGAETEFDLAHVVNAVAPGVLAEEAGRIGAALIHYSTDYVFDGRKASPYRPDDEPNPINVYGRTKLAGEQAIIASGARHLILRTSWVYSTRRKNFLLTILRLAASQPELRVVNDQHGCPSWSRLIADGTAQILSLAAEGRDIWTQRGVACIYHLACTDATTWYELARHIVNTAGVEPMPTITPITSAEYPVAAQRPRYSVLDCRKTSEDFGVDVGPWRPAVSAALLHDRQAVIAATSDPNDKGTP
jgi:dTDP-4-dehydrorhamnose reductase